MLHARRWVARGLDALAVLVVLFALFQFFVAPRLHENAVVPAPPIALQSLDGARRPLADFRGHLVFLDFWASWCEPCKLSIPLIERYKAAHPAALVYSIDAGENESVAARYARKANMRRVAFDPNMKASDAFGVDVFPTMIVIGRDGKEHAKWIGFNPLIGRDMARAASAF